MVLVCTLTSQWSQDMDQPLFSPLFPVPSGHCFPYMALEDNGLINYWPFAYDLGQPDNNVLIPEEFPNISDHSKDRQTDILFEGRGYFWYSPYHPSWATTHLWAKTVQTKIVPHPYQFHVHWPRKNASDSQKFPSTIKHLYSRPIIAIFTTSLT